MHRSLRYASTEKLAELASSAARSPKYLPPEKFGELSRRVLLYSTSQHFLLKSGSGVPIPNVAPYAALVPQASSLVGELYKEYEKVNNNQPGLPEALVSRIFIPFKHRSAKQLRQTMRSFENIGLFPMIVCSMEDAQSLRNAGIPENMLLEKNRTDSFCCYTNAVFLYYSSDAVKSFTEIQNSGRLLAKSDANFTEDVAQATRHIKFHDEKKGPCTGPIDNTLYILPYDEKRSYLDRILDSVFYMERWALLSKREKILRCISTALLAFTVIFPLICFIIKIGRTIHYRSGMTGKKLAIYKKHFQKPSIYEVLSSPQKYPVLAEEIRRIVNESLTDAGYIKDGVKTERATSLLHNLLLLSPKSKLKTPELVLRYVVYLSLLITCALRIAHLILAVKNQELESRLLLSIATIPLAILCFVFSVIICLGVKNRFRHPEDTVSRRNSDTFVCIITGLCLITTSIAYAVSYFWSNTYVIHQGTEIFLSWTIIAIIAAVLVLLCCVNIELYQEKQVAKILGLNYTTYTKIEKRVRDQYLDPKDCQTRALLKNLGFNNVEEYIQFLDIVNSGVLPQVIQTPEGAKSIHDLGMFGYSLPTTGIGQAQQYGATISRQESSSSLDSYFSCTDSPNIRRGSTPGRTTP